MLSFKPFAVFYFLPFTGALTTPVQAPLQQLSVPAWGPKLHGRMLHITDMHPDPHYVPHSSKKRACHRKKKEKGSGYYGTPNAECDSPLTLINFTLNYLEANWASEIDFVVWTGDSARHHNDEKIPRTPEEIKNTNIMMATRMKEIFLDRGIPVIPSLGNNDIWPHNTMVPGPNEITHAFSRIWEKFIPREHTEAFRRGAYFSVEVIPSEVAVISLNTIYFYDSNDVVNGCPYTDPEDPGNLHFNWLETQIQTFRDRGMQVWLIGHVPPSPGNYYPECYVRYVDIALRYQDTILGHLFGHMNVDFFFFLEHTDLQIISDKGIEDKASASGHQDLFHTLMDEFSALPASLEKVNLDDYAVMNVSPSLVPNPYVPAFRVYSYNVTGRDGQKEEFKKRKHGHRRGRYGEKETECSKERWRDSWKCHLNGTQHSDPESPSRSNQQWTPLGYAQYYIPGLAEANETQEPTFELEYVTFKTEEGKGYDMEDLTIGSWIQLAQRLGHGKEREIRREFRKHLYVGQE